MSNASPLRSVLFLLILLLAPARLAAAAENPRTLYARIDAVALNAPPEAERTPQALATYLASNAHDEREKVRALYRWMTANIDYDTEAFLRRRASALQPVDVLRTRRAICEGFATFFVEVGEMMGLEAVYVTGYAKGFGIAEGQRLRSPNHAWNAVRIDGTWHLLDATWGGGYVEGRGWRKEFQEHYFLPTPEQMIFSHLPEDARWQLLHRPISRRQFERQRSVPRALFALGVSTEAIHRETQAQGRRFRGYVESFEAAGHEVRIEAAPLGRYLSQTGSYRFVVRIPEATEVVLGGPGQEWKPLEGEGGTFRAEAALPRGTWQLFARFAGEESHRVLLQYTVE